MNIFSFLLSGASFATSLLAPAQWLIPAPGCLPLRLEPYEVWQSAQVSGQVTGNTMTFSPLLQGEVTFTWQLTCEAQTVFRLDWDIAEESFVQGIFEHSMHHSQEFHSQQTTTYLQGPGDGKITLYFPQAESRVSLTLLPESGVNTYNFTHLFSSPWRVFLHDQKPLPAFFEVRSAVTGYFPQEKDTTAVSCHTQGDLLVANSESHCKLARVEALATENLHTLYSVQKSVVQQLSPNIAFVKPNTPGEVIISEVMWAGSYFLETSLQSDQWIELYNATNSPLNLSGARLRGARPLSDIIFYSDFLIPPKSFVLIGKHGYDKTSLIRNPERIELLSLPLAGKAIQFISAQGVVLDETPPPPWPAGKDDQVNNIRSSMQRRWSELPGNDPSNWGDCSHEQESFRCTEVSKKQWRSTPGQNLGTPWQYSVL